MKNWLKILIIICLTAFVYRDSFTSRFFQDDAILLKISQTVSVFNPIPNYPYRPVAIQLFYGPAFNMFGLNPTGYHIILFVAFCATVYFVYLIARELLGKSDPAIITAFFYALNISIFANFYWIANSYFSLGAFLFFATIYFYLKSGKLSLVFFYLSFILALGLGLRLINLNQSLWLDEAITAVAVRNNSFIELLIKFSPNDFHPPLYYLFLKLWTIFFGFTEIVLRMPSVIFGVLAIFFIYKIGGKKAAILMAVNPLAIYYSQEARMYSLAMLLVTASVFFFIKKKRFLFVLSFLAALYTDYVPWLMFPVFLSKEIFWVIPGLFPLAPLLLTQIGSVLGVVGSSWGDILGRASLKNLFLVSAKFIVGRISLPVWLYAIFGAVYGYFMTFSRNKIYWAWFTVPLILGFILSFKIPIFTYFRFLFVLPAFILLLSQGSKKIILFITLISLGSLVYFNLNQNFWRENWYGAARYMETSKSLAIIPSLAQSAPLSYYNFKNKLVDVNQPIDLTETKTVYLIRYVSEIFDPRDIALKAVENQGFRLVENKNFNGVVVWKFIY